MLNGTKRAERPAGLSDPVLWTRIRRAPLPSCRDGSEFSRALALATDLPMSEARDVEQEYRRFLYLAAISDAQRVPPRQVRQAWEIHAAAPEYTAFCSGVLNKSFPYDDGTRMLGATGAYQRTRTDYIREFGQRPPRFIWPEGIAPRTPRWLGTHATILGFSGLVAWGQREPLILAAGLGLSLVLYAFDLWSSQLRQRRDGLGEAASNDLNFFLKGSKS